MSEEKKMPVAKAKAGGIDTAIWENKSKQGKKYNTVSIVKSYKKDDQSEWQTTKTIFPNDLENLIKALTELKTQADEKGLIKKK